MNTINYDNMVKFLTLVKQYMTDHLSENMSWGISRIDNTNIIDARVTDRFNNNQTMLMSTYIADDNDWPIEIVFRFNSATSEFYPDETNFFAKIQSKISSGKSLDGSAKIFLDILQNKDNDNPKTIEITAQIKSLSIGLLRPRALRITDILSDNHIDINTFSDETVAELRVSTPDDEYDYVLLQITKNNWTFV